jgi:hypothetical protein
MHRFKGIDAQNFKGHKMTEERLKIALKALEEISRVPRSGKNQSAADRNYQMRKIARSALKKLRRRIGFEVRNET